MPLIVLLIAIALAGPLWAQEELETQRPPQLDSPLITDRPGFNFPASTVGAGVVQLETGLDYSKGRDGSQLFFTPAALRIGTGPDTELRIDSPALFWDSTNRGVAPVNLGTKWNFHKTDDLNVGWIVTLGLPGGSGSFRQDIVVPSMLFMAEVPIAEGWGFNGTVGAALPEDGTGTRFVQTTAAALVSHSFTDEFAAYLELATVGPDTTNGYWEVVTDLGLSYYLNDDVQLDTAIFRGLSGPGLEWGITTGLSMRF